MSAIGEPFSEGASLAHRLDPRGIVVVAALFAVLMAAAQTYAAALAGLALALICLALARLPWKKVAVRLLVVNSFIFFLWVVLPLTYPGEEIWRFGPLAVSRQGLVYTGLITLKSNAIIIAFIALVATVPVVTLTAAFGGLVFGLQTYSGFHRYIGAGSEAYGGSIISIDVFFKLSVRSKRLVIPGRSEFRSKG